MQHCIETEAVMTKIVKTDAEWQSELTPEEFEILRNRGTEQAGTGEYEKHFPKEGYYVCKGCQLPLYSFTAKYESGCGWPAYNKCYKSQRYNGSHVIFLKDTDHGKTRLEIKCKQCDGHLGHMFVGAKSGNENERHCVNSRSVKYVKEAEPDWVSCLELHQLVGDDIKSELDDVKHGLDDPRNKALAEEVCVKTR